MFKIRKWVFLYNNQLIGILSFFIIVIPRIILSIQMLPGISTQQDEFSTLYSAAYYAGYDWSNIGINYSSYYGFGFTALLSLCYRIFSEGLIIYRAILIINSILPGICVLIAYKIIKKYGNIKTNHMIWAISVSSIAISGRFQLGMRNENILNLCTWILLYLILMLCEKETGSAKKRYGTLLLFIVCAYSCTIHTRAKVFYVIIAGIVIIFAFKYKKIIISKSITFIGFLLYFIVNLYIKNVQNILWNAGNRTVNNTSIIAHLSNNTGNLPLSDCIKSVLFTFFGQLEAFSAITAGIGIICLTIMGSFALKIMFKHIQSSNAQNSEYEEIFLCGFLFVGIGILGFILGISYSVRKEIFRTLEGDGSNITYRYLGLVRYYSSFLAPMLTMFFLFVMRYKNSIKREIKISAVIYTVISYVYIKYIYFFIKGTGWASDAIKPLFWNRNIRSQMMYIIATVLITVLFFWVYRMLIKQRYWGIILILFFWGSNEMYFRGYDALDKREGYEAVNGGYEALKNLKDFDNTLEKIYVIDTKNESNQIFYTYQILLYDFTIYVGYPEEKDALVLSNDDSLIIEGAYQMQLDENEWLYIKGEKYKEIIEYEKRAEG